MLHCTNQFLTKPFGAVLVALFFAAPSVGQEWTRFRGPNGSGVSAATSVPVEWTDDDYNWVLPLPGEGHSSPVVWGERLFLTSSDLDLGQRWVICVDTRRGEIAWKKSFPFQRHPKHGNNSFATNTPAVDVNHVYVLWQSKDDSTLVALDHDGNEAWRHSLGIFKCGHGPGVSPIVYEDMVIVANDQDGPSSLLAVDRHTGKPRWNVPRKSRRASYATPCIFTPKNRPPEIIFADMHHGITAVDPGSGKVNWEISVFGTFKQRAIASPLVTDDLVIGLSGFTTAEKNLVAVKPEPNGEGVAVKEMYRISKTVPHLPTPLIYDGRMFLWTDRGGIVTCVEAATGKQVWQKRIGGDFSASPVCVNGKIYCANDDGVVYVIAASDKFELLARNELGHPTRATPAIAGGAMYFRTYSHVFSLGGPTSGSERDSEK